MGIRVKVRTYTREVIGSSTHPAISALCAKAAGTSLPLLSGSTHTTTPPSIAHSSKAWRPSSKASPGLLPDEREALEEILALTELADRKPPPVSHLQRRPRTGFKFFGTRRAVPGQ
jgi:hypothetical protein